MAVVKRESKIIIIVYVMVIGSVVIIIVIVICESPDGSFSAFSCKPLQKS